MIHTSDRVFQGIIDDINAGLTRAEFEPALKIGRNWMTADNEDPGYCLTPKQSLALGEVLAPHKHIILPD